MGIPILKLHSYRRVHVDPYTEYTRLEALAKFTPTNLFPIDAKSSYDGLSASVAWGFVILRE